MDSTKNTYNLDNLIHTKEFIFSLLLPLLIATGSWWATLVTSDLVIRSLSFISMALIILINLVKFYDRFRHNKKIKD